MFIHPNQVIESFEETLKEVVLSFENNIPSVLDIYQMIYPILQSKLKNYMHQKIDQSIPEIEKDIEAQLDPFIPQQLDQIVNSSIDECVELMIKKIEKVFDNMTK
jgi:hypothetical protein